MAAGGLRINPLRIPDVLLQTPDMETRLLQFERDLVLLIAADGLLS